MFDADGHDRAIELTDEDATDLVGKSGRRLIWIDVDLERSDPLGDLELPVELSPAEIRRLEGETDLPRLIQGVERLHLTLRSLEPEDPEDPDGRLVRREVALIAVPGVVMSLHRGTVDALDRFADGLSAETALGLLDAGDLMTSLVDEIIAGYYRLAERIESQIDRLDDTALRGPGEDVLARIVAIRRRISLVRRTLAPHRSALAALARPEMRTAEAVGQPWPGLVERLEGAMAAVEALRESLLGTYDIHMGRVAQRANDVMKALTLLSAVLLPAVVLAGIMGMNFRLGFFDQPSNFFVVIGAMGLFAALLVVIARWRHWL